MLWMTMLKSLTWWIITTCGKFLKRWEYQTTLPVSWEICMKVKKQQLEADTNWFKIGKGVCQSCILSPCLFNLYAEYIIWNAGLNDSSWNQDCREKYQQPQIYRWHHSNGRKWRGAKEPLDEDERGEWKSWLKTQVQKMKIMASGPITSWQIDGKTMKTVTDFYFLGVQNHCRQWLQPWNQKMLAPWKKSYDQPR